MLVLHHYYNFITYINQRTANALDMYHVAYESTCISHANDGYLKGSMTMIRKETLWLLTYLTYSAKKKLGEGKLMMTVEKLQN